MKICLYFEAEKMIQTSGIGRALQHQKKALESAGIPYTLDPSEDFDILHINTIGPSSMAVLALTRKRGKAIVFHAHSTEEDFRNSFVLSNQVAPLFKRHLVNLYSQADVIITPTPYAKTLLENYGLKLPIHPISNGVELLKYEKDADKEKAFRRYFGLSEKSPVIIGVGLYLQRKGLQDFMEIAKQFPDITFIWFGHSPLITIPKALRTQIEDHPSNVILPGYVKGPIIEGAYTSADLFFFPSYEETEGIVVLEALASKCPVLVRDIGVYDPWLIDRVNCFKANSNEGFSRIIRDFYAQTLPDTTQAGYEVAAQRNLNLIGQKLLSIYQEVMSIEGGQK